MVNYAALPNNTASAWWRDAGLRKNVLHIVTLYTAVYSLGYDGSLLNGLQALPAWQSDFGSPKGTTLGLIAASLYLPKIPVLPLLSWFVDRYGRKPNLMLGAVLLFAGSFLGAFCNNVAGLVGSRIMLGVGTVAAHMSATALVAEIAHPRIRPYASSYLLTTFYIGSIFASWLTFAMVYWTGTPSWSWRLPNLVQGFGPMLLVAGGYFVPESPRWLMKKGREEEAHRILARYHSNGVMEDPLVLLEVREIKAGIQLDDIGQNSSWRAFFATPANRMRLFVVILVGSCTQLAGNGVVQYYLVPVLKTVGIVRPEQTAGINGGLAVWNFLCALTGAGMVERFGRRSLFLFALCGMLASFILITGLSGGYAGTGVQSVGISMVPFIFVFMGFYSSAFTPVPLLYMPEIVPLALRAKAIAVFGIAQAVSQAFNQFVNPVALAAIAWKFYFVYVAVLIAYLAAFFFFIRETKGLTVEEAAVVYESGENKEKMLEQERALAEQLARTVAGDDMIADSKSLDEKVERV